MIKKIMSLVVLMSVMVFVSSMATSFAQDAYEIIEPSLGDNNEIFGKNLLINIAIFEEKPIYMTLLKVELKTSNSFLPKKSGSGGDTNFISLPDLEEDYTNGIDLDGIDDFEMIEIKSSYSEKEKRKIAEEYTFAVEEAVEAQNTFIYNYNMYNDKFFVEEVGKIEIPLNLTDEQAEFISQYKDSYRDMMKANNRYEYLSEIYEKIYETIVIDSENILEKRTLLSYRTTVENIKPGNYKLILKDDEDEILEELDFLVKEKLTKDQILEEKPNPVKDLIQDVK